MNARRTRLEDLAALAKVSIATASRALNDSPAVNARTKQLIWKLAKEHDYPFRRTMPAGPIGATGTIALAIPQPQGRGGQMSDPFVLELFAGIGDAARERGCDLMVSHFAPTSFDDLAAAMATSRADGVIFLGQSSLHHAFNHLAQTEGRFAVWGAQLPDQAYCSVGTDNLAGGRRATLHLARTSIFSLIDWRRSTTCAKPPRHLLRSPEPHPIGKRCSIVPSSSWFGTAIPVPPRFGS